MPANSISSRGSAVWLVLALTFLAYANSFAGAFLFDDHAVILDDPRLQSLAAFRSSVGEAIRPFTKATFLVDRWFYGDRPAGYHTLNLLLHLASGFLLYRILSHPSLRDATASGDGNDQRPIAFWTMLLFLLHPIATETVTYISGRPTGLMTCGYLAAFLLFLEARVAEPGSSRQMVMVVSAMACLALSLLAKEVAVVFPAMVVLYEAVVRPKEARWRDVLIRIHVPLLAVVLVFLSFAVFHARYAFLFRYSLALRGWYDNLLTQANAVVYAIALFFRPNQLNFDHDLPLYSSIFHGPTLFSIAVLACLLGASVALVRRAPLFSFGVLWFLLHLLPTNSILPRYDVLSERNLYLPSIGFYLATVVAAIGLMRWLVARGAGSVAVSSWVTPYQRLMASSSLVVLVLWLVGTTARRNAIYADPVTFWSDAVAKSQRKARPHTNLGYAWFVAGDVDRAIEEFRIALTLDPLDQVAQSNLLEVWKRKTHQEAEPR